MSPSEGTTPASTEVEISPTANEKSDESVSDSIENEIGIKKDGVHQEQSTSQVASNQSGPVDADQWLLSKIGDLFKQETKDIKTEIKAEMDANAEKIKS